MLEYNGVSFEPEILLEEDFYLLPETQEVVVGGKILSKYYSIAEECVKYSVYGWYRIIGYTEKKEFFQSYKRPSAAEKRFDSLQPYEMKYKNN